MARVEWGSARSGARCQGPALPSRCQTGGARWHDAARSPPPNAPVCENPAGRREGGRLEREPCFGLEVAVDDPGHVGGREPATGRDHHPQHLVDRVRTLLKPRPQRAPADERGHQEHRAVLLARLEDAERVGMLEPRERPRLADHPTALLLSAPARLRAQDLQRDLAVEQRIVRREHDPRRAFSEAIEHHEPADLERRCIRAKQPLLERPPHVLQLECAGSPRHTDWAIGLLHLHAGGRQPTTA